MAQERCRTGTLPYRNVTAGGVLTRGCFQRHGIVVGYQTKVAQWKQSGSDRIIDLLKCKYTVTENFCKDDEYRGQNSVLIFIQNCDSTPHARKSAFPLEKFCFRNENQVSIDEKPVRFTGEVIAQGLSGIVSCPM